MNILTELASWLGELEPAFAFLLALPFAVAAAALLSDRARRHRADAAADGRREPGLPSHRTPVRAP